MRCQFDDENKLVKNTGIIYLLINYFLCNWNENNKYLRRLNAELFYYRSN